MFNSTLTSPKLPPLLRNADDDDDDDDDEDSDNSQNERLVYFICLFLNWII